MRFCWLDKASNRLSPDVRQIYTSPKNCSLPAQNLSQIGTETGTDDILYITPRLLDSVHEITSSLDWLVRQHQLILQMNRLKNVNLLKRKMFVLFKAWNLKVLITQKYFLLFYIDFSLLCIGIFFYFFYSSIVFLN